MIEGELRSETIEKFAELGLFYLPREVFMAVLDIIDIIDIDPWANEILGNYVDALLAYFPHLDGRNRDDIIRILHGHRPEYGKPRLPMGEEEEEEHEKPRKKRFKFI